MMSVGLSVPTRARLCVSVAVVFAGLLLFSASAVAVRGHVFSHAFGSPGSAPGELKEPDGVAVNEATGMVYIADKGNDRVQFFDGVTGALEGEFNGSGELPNEGRKAGAGGVTNEKGEPLEEETGRFSGPSLVAVDDSCEQHKPVLSEATSPTCKQYDPSYGDVYVVDGAHNVVDKYTAGGEYIGQINAKSLGGLELWPFEGLLGVAVEGDGDLLVSTWTRVPVAGTEEGVFRLSNGVVNVALARSGVPTGFTGTSGLGFTAPGLGVAGGRVFVHKELFSSPGVSVWGLGGELLDERLFSGDVAGLAGEVCSGDVYVDVGGVMERLEGSGGVVESLVVPGGGGSGVAPDCRSLSVFVADADAGVVDVFGPEPPGRPSIERGSGYVTEVSDDGAKLFAMVNPRSEPGETETVYAFEYGPCPSEGSCGSEYPDSVEGSLSASYEPEQVSVTLRGLAADTRYHYRVSAHNAYDLGAGEAVVGEELFFTTQPSLRGGLLDGRGWELVSPPDKRGADLESLGEGVTQAAVDGEAVTYLASAATEASPAGAANREQVFSRRTASGWVSCDVGLAHEYATGPPAGVGEEYLAFSEDLGLGVVQPFGRLDASVSAEASELSPYLGDFTDSCGGSPTYRPLVTGCPAAGEPCPRAVEEHADVPAGTKFGEEQFCAKGVSPRCGPRFEGSNASLSAVVLEAQRSRLVEEVNGVTVPDGALYEWHGGELSVVSVLPSGSVLSSSVVNGPKLGTQNGPRESFRGAVSEDGSRVVWSEHYGHLFVWDRATGKSARVDVVQGGSGEGSVGPLFQFATADGSRVFFTDTQRLTAGAGATDGKPDLYACEVQIEGEGEGAKPKCVLHDLTPATASGESAGVLGEAIGASGDASTIYFVADGVLGENTDTAGEKAVKGTCEDNEVAVSERECNLYEWHDGAIRLVAVLSGEDSPDWGATLDGGSEGDTADLEARVSGDGRWLAFMSDRSLTGYDTRDAQHLGVRDEEVYLYDSASGRLVCVSCEPSGERPVGVEYGINGNGAEEGLPLVGGVKVWAGTAWLAANLPVSFEFSLLRTQHESRYLDESGRLFFDSADELVPADTNHTEDVYEYEPANVGSCKENGPGYVSADEGCLGLLSSGESPEESAFLDASENGDDVFFLTASKLSKRDIDTSLDVYDARVGGGEPEESKPVECQGDACQAPVSPPESLTPSSLTSNGPGNLLTPPAPGSNTKTTTKPKAKTETRQQKLAKALEQCRKDRSKGRRKRCESRARATYGTKAKGRGKTTKRRVG